MGTNKTRLFVAEPASSVGPYVTVTEFDIYQEAIDYAQAIVKYVRMYDTVTGTAIEVYVMSYDNISYRYKWDGNDFITTEVPFPVEYP